VRWEGVAVHAVVPARDRRRVCVTSKPITKKTGRLAWARRVLGLWRMRDEARQNEIAHVVIGCSLAVHRRIGPGCFEGAYTPCLAHELAQKGLRFDVDVVMDLVYDRLIVPRAYRIDFIVEDSVVLEIKALEQTGRIHGRQVLTYLRLTGLALGLLLNFGAGTMRDGVERVVNNFPHGTEPIGRRSGNAATGASDPGRGPRLAVDPG
jgi:GxxExxY protein